MIATAVSVHVCERNGQMIVCLYDGNEVCAMLAMNHQEALAFGEMYVEKLRASSFYASAAETQHREGHA